MENLEGQADDPQNSHEKAIQIVTEVLLKHYGEENGTRMFARRAAEDVVLELKENPTVQGDRGGLL